MNFQISIDIPPPYRLLNYSEPVLLTGSCFTEHIGNALHDLKFKILQNPHGILFDPASVCRNLNAIADGYVYTEKDLFLLNEVWNSWDHHSRYSSMDKTEALRMMNASLEEARHFLLKAGTLIITLGSSFSYRLTEKADGPPEKGAANCHRAPAAWFQKYMMTTAETVYALKQTCQKLLTLNTGLQFIFTVSPVRHLRDGVAENNRSKGRLLEAVHLITEELPQAYYFPAYELVIDVLRDYRFYDIDLAHPNYAATEFVLEHFKSSCLAPEARELSEEIRKIVIARRHKAFQPATHAHRQFLSTHYEKTKILQEKYPGIDFSEELAYFAP